MSDNLKVHTMADYIAEGKSPEVLFWIGCAGSFDDRAKKITKAFVKILNSIIVKAYAEGVALLSIICIKSCLIYFIF